jgi:hypothetical protein
VAKKTAGGKPRKPERQTTAPNTGEPEIAKKKLTGRAGNRLTLVRKLIAKFAGDLEHGQRQSGVSELAKLIALEKELAESRESVREIKVTWVEPDPAESSKSR